MHTHNELNKIFASIKDSEDLQSQIKFVCGISTLKVSTLVFALVGLVNIAHDVCWINLDAMNTDDIESFLLQLLGGIKW